MKKGLNVKRLLDLYTCVYDCDKLKHILFTE